MKYHFRSVAILDDDPVSGFILFSILEKHDLFAKQVKLFLNPQRLLAFLSDHAESSQSLPELIFLNIQIPVINGFQFIEYMARLPGKVSSSVKIVLLSDFQKDQAIDQLIREKKIIAFIQKPATMNNLDQIIEIAESF